MKLTEIKKEHGNYIKSDIYSTAVSILQMCNPEIKGNKTKQKTLELKIKDKCPKIYGLLK